MSDLPLLDLCGLRGGRRMVWLLDNALQVLDASDQSIKLFPSLLTGTSFFNAFEFVRPRRVNGVDDLLAHGEELILGIPKSGYCAIRGSILRTRSPEQPFLFFGAPWLTWMRENRPDIQLGFEDFDTSDSQLDLLFVLSSERQHLQDLEALTAELERARGQLEQASALDTAHQNALKAQIMEEAAGLAGLLSTLGERLPDEASQAMANEARARVERMLSLLAPQ